MADEPLPKEAALDDEWWGQRPDPLPDGPLRRYMEHVIELLRVRFQQTADPFDLWRAYALLRMERLPLPEWLLHEFDVNAIRLGVAWFGPPGWPHHKGLLNEPHRDQRWPLALAEAFGFPPQHPAGGSADPIRRTVRHDRDEMLAVRVGLYVKDGNNPTNACMLVAQEAGVSERMVRDAWKTFEPVARGWLTFGGVSGDGAG